MGTAGAGSQPSVHFDHPHYHMSQLIQVIHTIDMSNINLNMYEIVQHTSITILSVMASYLFFSSVTISCSCRVRSPMN